LFWPDEDGWSWAFSFHDWLFVGKFGFLPPWGPLPCGFGRLPPPSPTASEARLLATEVSLVRVAAGTRLRVVLATTVVRFRVGPNKRFVPHELRAGYARGSRLVVEVELVVLLEARQGAFFVIVEQVFAKTVGFDQANTAELRPFLELREGKIQRRRESNLINSQVL
jgi:hypothetical protein